MSQRNQEYSLKTSLPQGDRVILQIILHCFNPYTPESLFLLQRMHLSAFCSRHKLTEIGVCNNLCSGCWLSWQAVRVVSPFSLMCNLHLTPLEMRSYKAHQMELEMWDSQLKTINMFLTWWFLFPFGSTQDDSALEIPENCKVLQCSSLLELTQSKKCQCLLLKRFRSLLSRSTVT